MTHNHSSLMEKSRFFSLEVVATLILAWSLPATGEARARRSRTGQTPVSVPTVPHDRAEQVRQAQVVVVTGSADHMEQVLQRARVKHVVVRPEELTGLPLHSQQVLMVNCRGVMSEAARERVRRFVAAGGFLYTTDHAVRHLIEPLFPRTIAFNNTTTSEQVFPMEVSGKRGLLRKLGSSATIHWQLANGGYLFKVLDQKRVEVLMRSRQVARHYNGDGVLGVRFKHEDGYVIHVTGHFFTQPGQVSAVARAGRAFEQLSANVVLEKQADRGRIDSLYNRSARREVTLQAAPAASAPSVSPASVTTQSLSKGSRVRVLKKDGNYLKVRDSQGNEGWVDASDL